MTAAEVLTSGDWRPLTDYEPSKSYVYVRGFAQMAPEPTVAVGRRGRHELAYWWGPDGQPLPLGITDWKPLPLGRSAFVLSRALYDYDDRSFVRPPEPVYAPGGVDAKLGPVSRGLLVAMRDGAVLHERAWRWTSWSLRAPGSEVRRINERPINPLRKLSFIERDGILPPGRLDRWYEFDWNVTEAGQAWLAGNVTAS